MPLSLLNNLASITAQYNINNTQKQLQSSVERLSSGMRIVHASDDAAGLAIGATLSAELVSIQQAGRNAQDATSMTQMAEAGMADVQGLLTRMRQLAVQSANGGTLSASNRASLDTEFQALLSEISRIVGSTKYNGVALINGSLSTGTTFQLGAFNTTNDRFAVNIADVGTGSTALNISSAAVNTIPKAQGAMGALDTAIQTLATSMAKVGASQQRLSVAIDNLQHRYVNLASSRSHLLDVDVAEETANLTRTQVMLQAGVSVLAQANQQAASVLTLLGR